MTDRSTHLYGYPARMRYAPLIVAAVWIGVAIALFVYRTLETGYWPPTEKRMIYFAPWLALVSLALLAQLYYRRRFVPILLTEEGLWLGGMQGASSQLVAWGTIERAHRLIDAKRRGFVSSRGGILVWTRSRRFLIHESIQDVDDLWRRMEGQLARRKLRW